MGIAKLYSQSGGIGLKINGIVQDYYVYAGEIVKKGDFVELLTASNGVETETQVRKATTSDIYGVAKTSGTGGDSAGHKDVVRIYTRIAKGDIIPKTWTATDDTGKSYVAPDGTKLIVDNPNATVINLTNAFDGDADSYAEISAAYSVQIIFPTAKTIRKIKTKIDTTYEGTLSYTVHAYKKADSTSYDAIVSKIVEPKVGLIEYSLENIGCYEKYSFSPMISNANGKTARIYEIQTTEYEI